MLHLKAKEEPELRFHSLIDKVWRMDFLRMAWQAVRRNGGAAGVDGVSIADVESHGVEKWLGELSQDLQTGAYTPHAVRQALIPKKQRGKFRPLGIPCLRDRVAQTSALLVLNPIFEADLEPEQYAYRSQRGALDAVERVHRLLSQGHRHVVDADLSNYFGEIPHAELMKCLARRISDGRMLKLLKAWLEMPTEAARGSGGSVRTNAARRERKGIPQGAPISPLLSNIYMRRFLLDWKLLGFAERFGAVIVNYADDFVVLGRVPAERMLAVVTRLMNRLKLPLNASKTRCLRCPAEPFEFLGYRIGWNYRRNGGGRYLGTRPSKASVQSLCRRISEQTHPRSLGAPPGAMIGKLNRTMSGWANYFVLGQAVPAYEAVDLHAIKRLRKWFCRKHKVKSGHYVRFSDERLRNDHGLTRLATTTKSLPWAKR